jgi:hypothetical protein
MGHGTRTVWQCWLHRIIVPDNHLILLAMHASKGAWQESSRDYDYSFRIIAQFVVFV